MDYFWWGMGATVLVLGAGALLVWLTRDDEPRWPYDDDDEGGL